MDASQESYATVARQPIFNFSKEVVAYELLYREYGSNSYPQHVDPAAATARVIQSATFDIGLEELVGSRPVYINVPESLLAAAPFIPLPAQRVVVEILESVEIGAAVRAAIAAMRKEGYRIALDDFSGSARDWEFLELADVVKVDLGAVTEAQLAELAAELKARGRRHLVAEKVETAAQFDLCRRLGFDSFQGYLLQRPETFSKRSVAANELATLELVIALHDPDCTIDRVERLLARDVSLSLKVLGCINSCFYNLPRRIESLRAAVVALGFEQLGRLCAVVALAGFSHRPDILQTNALIRARMSQLLAEASQEPGSGQYFLVGLLSCLDALLEVPLQKAVELLPLEQGTRDAILGNDSQPANAVRCACAYERGQYEAIRFARLGRAEIGRCYLQAIQWAEANRTSAMKA